MPVCKGLFGPKGSRLELLKSALNAKNSYASCLTLLSPAISSQFTFKVCAAAKNCEKIALNSFLGIQGCIRSSMLINQKPVASACYDKQHVCTYLQPFSRYTSQ